MSFKKLFLVVFVIVGTLGSYAQKGVENGTRFGSGEDSVRCITNISLFVPYAKQGNFADAYKFWKQAYEECPAAHKDIYLHGVKIMDWKIQTEKDPVKKQKLIEDLMKVYDTRVKYFGQDRRYGKDWIVGRKANDYIRFVPTDKMDFKLLYGWLKEVMDEYKENTNELAISLFMFASYNRFNQDPEFKQQYVDDYVHSIDILNNRLEEAKKRGKEKSIKILTGYKSGIETGFASSGAADCQTLQEMFASQVEDHKDDIEFLKNVIALLRKVRCQEIEVYFLASSYAHEIQPTAESAVGCAKQAYKKKDYSAAIEYFEEAVKLSDNAADKAEFYYSIAAIAYEQNHYAQARTYCNKAIHENGSYGSPYILIANMYANSASSIYPDDPVLRKCVYYLVVDKLERARQVDPSVADEVNRMIVSYRNSFPSNEDVFMHPLLEKGKSFTVGGWIGETTRVR